MVRMECPWCAGPAVLGPGEPAGGSDAVDCADCGVRVDVAPDPIVSELAKAA